MFISRKVLNIRDLYNYRMLGKLVYKCDNGLDSELE